MNNEDLRKRMMDSYAMAVDAALFRIKPETGVKEMVAGELIHKDDIVVVGKGGKLWRYRDKRAKELTVEEISKRLGYEVKVVK